MLDDPALWPAARPIATQPIRAELVRFRSSSTFARDFYIPVGAVAEVRSRYKQDGREMLDGVDRGLRVLHWRGRGGAGAVTGAAVHWP